MNPTEFTEIALCPICEHSDYVPLWASNYPENISFEEFKEVFKSSSDAELFDQLVNCKECGLAYLNPRIRSDIILNGYADAEDLRFVSQNDFRIRTFYKKFRKWLGEYKIPLNKEVAVLDVGCAAGAFPKAAHDLGLSVIGVEPSRFLSEIARNEYGLDIRPGLLQDQNFSNNSFNIISLWDVIEHLIDPSEVLGEIKRILDDDGFLLVNYPEYDSWPRKLLGKKWPFFLNVHLFYFTPETIKKLMAKNGFEVLKVEPYFQTLELGYILERAGKVLPFFKFVAKLVNLCGIGKIPFTYYIGQTLVTAKKQKS